MNCIRQIKSWAEDLILYRTSIRNLDDENLFRSVFEKALSIAGDDAKVLEIGTCQGISTAILAQMDKVKSVTTIDVEYSRVAENLWRKFEIFSKISYGIVENEIEKMDLLKDDHFDVGFIDGDHTMMGVISDYMTLKEICNVIVFHDYNRIEDVTIAIDTILRESVECDIYEPFVIVW